METALPIHVAIVDSQTLVRKGMIELISSFACFKVCADAKDSNELIKTLEHATLMPDVCIVDISKSLIEGYETVAHLKTIYPSLKILALSIYDNEFSIIKILRQGANGYLLKDCELKDLHRALTDIHHTGFYYSEIVTARLFHLLQSNDADMIPKLSVEELKFLSLCCTEMTYKEVADSMHHSPRTIEAYRCTLFEKLKVKSRVGLVMYALRIGIVSINAFTPNGVPSYSI